MNKVRASCLWLGIPLLWLTPPASAAWKKQEPPSPPWDFYDVDMVSTGEGWAVSHPITGDHGNIFHTINGGKTWKQQGHLFRQLSAISFADMLHGVAVGNEFRYTVDGGRSWQLSNTLSGSM